MEPLFFIVIALIIGAATRHFLKKTPLPYTVLLMIFGIGLGLLVRFFGVEVGHGHEEHGHMGVWDKIVHAFMMAIKWAGEIDPHVILFVFLPILIFEAAFAMDVHTFKKIGWKCFSACYSWYFDRIVLNRIFSCRFEQS
jgi:NhaP-type Na+/H+ or K+/H+ antiporter